jgi:phosphoglycerate dehydrogenase-like enzyme
LLDGALSAVHVGAGGASQTIGVVGTGNIGLAAIRIFNGFGTRVIAHDPYGKPELAEQVRDRWVTLIARWVTLIPRWVTLTKRG